MPRYRFVYGTKPVMGDEHISVAKFFPLIGIVRDPCSKS